MGPVNFDLAKNVAEIVAKWQPISLAAQEVKNDGISIMLGK